MKNYSEYIKRFKNLLSEAKDIPLAASECGVDFKSAYCNSSATCVFDNSSAFAGCSKKALIFAPHPDDESMVGSLALRLMQECGFEVKNIAVTLGSNIDRRAGRLAELTEACKRLSWGLYVCGENGFDNIRPDARESNESAWRKQVEEIANVIATEKPAVIFFPHKEDWNKTHCGVSLLIYDALELLGDSWNGMVIETEFWGQNSAPNLMVEVPSHILAYQIEATSCHIKEVERNPYHLTLAALMTDNVRRGGEVVGGQGAAVPSFDFAMLYRAKLRKDGSKWQDAFNGKILPASENAFSIFKLI